MSERKKPHSAPIKQLTPDQRQAYSTELKRRLRAANQPEFRKAYLGALVERIELHEKSIRMCGSGQALAAGTTRFVVATFVQEWCP